MTFLECCDITPTDGASSVLALQPTTLLPSAEAPEMVIFQVGDHRWLIADRHGVRTLEEGTEVRMLGRQWRWRKSASARPLLTFRVSQDEEHVRLELAGSASPVDLGERAHHQSLLLLARERRADELRGVSSTECGWLNVDSLQRMLGIDLQHFNIHVFRARRQVEPVLREMGIAIEVVERRCGQVRFGQVSFAVVGGQRWPETSGSRECQTAPATV